MADSSKTEKTPRWSRRKGARPGEILAAALDLFVEHGYATTRLEDVAERAGVSKGTLYLYFPGKEELFKAVVRENLVSVLDFAEEMVAHNDMSSVELFRTIIMGWWQRIGNTKLAGISRLMMLEAANFPDLARFYHDEYIFRGRAMIRNVLEIGIERGDFRAVDTEQLTQIIVAPIVMLMMWRHSASAYHAAPVSPEPYMDSFIDLCLHGLLNEKATG
ncbi:MAG: TetR/AcrR family transcriptional regulator [Burkholderiaceae bacterium]|nr:TetR/AcrR family transcriptional regulator [Burkholderiaceae bacterium]